ncbi:hypothetical protein HNQ85_000687 [Anoxybacillus calidus]|jgi:hypothetical protein|uniref:Uncharacterized protein n=1 Tax=[Anoxybacillus] calidus TaxID=575178 RepID=A0A7W0BVX2_9BACL|nr:DUF3930 family protein [Anoxybacillus calidus]MBA2870429.1 hypothetical protein [Anoxybacillus calidus]
MDKHIEVTNGERMDETMTKWMETMTDWLFKIIVFLGIPYFLYILIQFFQM